jgi:glycosyltransferase involved in cell wall biosynthesis
LAPQVTDDAQHEFAMKILFTHKQILFPHDTGGKIRVLNLLRHLARWHEIIYLCNLRPGEEKHLQEMRALGLRVETVPREDSRRRSLRYYGEAILNVLTPLPFTVVRNFDPVLKTRAAALVRDESFDLMICDGIQMTPHFVDLPVPAKVLFQHNAEARLLERHAQSDPTWLRRRYMANQYRKMCRFEAEYGARFDAVIAVSEPDRQAFERDYGWPHVRAINTAVDLDYFQPTGRPEQAGRVVFVGSMDWLPNQDGAWFFINEVWPLIRARRPDATFQIVGRDPPTTLRRLSGRNGVDVVGRVPDVRPYLEEAAVIVVPILVGGGTRLKIYEAMAMGKPIVSTTIGAEGLVYTPREHLLVADDPTAFASSVLSLLEAPQVRGQMGESARRLVTERFSAETVARQFDEICRATVQRLTENSLRPRPLTCLL